MGTVDAQGWLNYMAPSVASSLYRNGTVLTRRDGNGNDAGTTGVDFRRHKQIIMNARTLSENERPSLARNGFELIIHPIKSKTLDFLNHESVVQDYYHECAKLVQQVTGAKHVFPFDHNIRSAGGKAESKRIEGGQEVQTPVHIVHGDYTLRSSRERLERLSRHPSGNDTFASLLGEKETLIPPGLAARALDGQFRFAIINVWRNISEQPVGSNALALCDARSVKPNELVVFEIHYQDRIGENYFAKYSDKHRWYFFPRMTRDEALLIKQWDSAGALATSDGERSDSTADQPCTFSFHSAFEDAVPVNDAPHRWSAEVRCLAVYA
ncbi:hypothetical protein BWQ96_09676 [Gracilariopsis chorda]|uniref:Methyltransferase n=1 Tax=Gracilariopsis chorda TaxID=448386 RepID=A0A2V3IEX4_9FLOR|nr:hypothetical protein BWQ96_09676 [Gracilariopsis chorda]|eukprot:PXF40613.1 hypothetical protein BWQ96_09676 [Gracilariopsis chorda]